MLRIPDKYELAVRAVITGGAGFIGTNLSLRLMCEGHEVRVFDDLSTGRRANMDASITEFKQGSIESISALEEFAGGCDWIVHFAARGSVPRSIAEPLATHSVNATGTLNVMEVARRVGARVIFSSSSSVYGANSDLPKAESMWTSPLSPLCSEQTCR